MRSLSTALVIGAVLLSRTFALEEEDPSIREFRSLLAVPPSGRSVEQRKTMRQMWRTNALLREKLRWVTVLQPGEAIFDFPGILAGKLVQYDAEKMEYRVSSFSKSESFDGGHDQWETAVFLSEDGIVLRQHRLKINSR